MFLLGISIIVLALGQTLLRYDAKYVKAAHPDSPGPHHSNRGIALTVIGFALAGIGAFQYLSSLF